MQHASDSGFLRGAETIGQKLQRSAGWTIFQTSTLVAIGCLALISASSSVQAASPFGVWVDHTGRGAVEVKKCGSRLCGVIVWARKAADASRGCGRKLFGGLRQVGRTSWDRGWIIAPDSGTKYDVAIKPLGRNRLEILGYAGSKLFSKTMIWKRAPAGLKRCDEPKAKPQILAEAKTKPPRRPSGVGAPGVPLVPEVAIKQPPPRAVASTRVPTVKQVATSPRMERIQRGNKPARIVYYDPPQSAPPPPRKPLPSSVIARLALETSGLGIGLQPAPIPRPVVRRSNDDAIAALLSSDGGASEIIPPRPRLAQRPVRAARVADDLIHKIRSAGQRPDGSNCRIQAPFVVSSVPCPQ
ncbi:MAG: DUF2147 domain-containing protein [Pseudomonadota bacterium]